MRDDNLEYARIEVNEGDFWHNTDLQTKVRDRINAEPVTEKKDELIAGQPSLTELFDRTGKYVTVVPDAEGDR